MAKLDEEVERMDMEEEKAYQEAKAEAHRLERIAWLQESEQK